MNSCFPNDYSLFWILCKCWEDIEKRLFLEPKSFTLKWSALVINQGLLQGNFREKCFCMVALLFLITPSTTPCFWLFQSAYRLTLLVDQWEQRSYWDHGPLLFCVGYGTWKSEQSPSEASAFRYWIQSHGDSHLRWRRRCQCLCPWKNLWVKLSPCVY